MTAPCSLQKFPIAMKATTLLDDPIMMEWAVHYYHDLPPHPELKGQLKNLWFHDVIIKRWMDADDPDVLGLMFLYRASLNNNRRSILSAVGTLADQERLLHDAEFP